MLGITIARNDHRQEKLNNPFFLASSKKDIFKLIRLLSSTDNFLYLASSDFIIMEQTYSNTSGGDKIGLYEFLEALGLLDNKFGLGTNTDDDNDEFWLSDDDNDGFWLFDGDNEDDDDSEDDDDYQNRFGEDALKKLYQAREARQRLILLRLFTMCLPNLSEQAKN
ncbi:hypothetical protein C2G38_2283948 [Gigaspora rosea]|uniref:Uncharacterized protein n=1 Tax=Gigaspora rosea TaxID=44941 RepID=A0A397U2M5_9GLOM|nr:hypothetical protein C2G38_2283948 [Gigaspora rosea]